MYKKTFRALGWYVHFGNKIFSIVPFGTGILVFTNLVAQLSLLVSFLLRVGSGKISLVTFEKVLSEQLNIEDKKPAFANGLYLSGVTYPYINVTIPKDISSLLKVGLV